MQKLVLILLILVSQLSYGQDLSRDLEFIETQNTQSSAFTLPIFVDLDGNLSLFSRSPEASMSVGPLAHVGYKTSISTYINPVQRTEFAFENQKSDLGWIEVKRKRWEAGLGIAASLASNFIAVGIAPFKGARQVMIRQKKTQDEVTPNPRLPRDMEDVRSWNVGDRGSFQRYGGVSVYVGARYMGINLLTVGVVIQNLFSVVVKKISDTKVQLLIGEENLNKRRLQSGLPVASIKVHFFNGKRLSTQFTLDLDDPYHHELYRLALKGKIHILQDKLPDEFQKLEWKGTERIGYIGIPSVAGKYTTRSEYKMDIDGEEEVLDMKTRRSTGWLIPLRNHNRLVYQTETAIILFWFSEMNKANEDVLDRKFLTPGRLMGAKGFDHIIPAGTKIGSTLSQMGMSFTREELDAVSPEKLEEILGNFKIRCEEMKLECRIEKKFKKIAKSLRSFMGQKWEDVRDNLGFLMIDEPALIHSYIKAIKSKKKVYFKFLNEKYQSMEGSSPIET
jgi:hypothetical protein